MNRFLKFLIGLGSFLSVIIVTGELSGNHRDEIAHFDYLNFCSHTAFTVAAVLFLQFALHRYLLPPDVVTNQQRQALIKSSESMGIFFTALSGLGYLCLILYASSVLIYPFDPLAAREGPSFFGDSLFFLFLALVGRTRGVILQLLGQQKTIQPFAETTQGMTALSQ